jgi:hypothetical protein
VLTSSRIRLVKNSMGKVIQFPVQTNEPGVDHLVYIAYLKKARMIDLAEHGRKLREVQKELRRLRARLELRVIKNETDKDQG